MTGRYELHLVGGTYAERCKTRFYWLIVVTAWQYLLLKSMEKTEDEYIVYHHLRFDWRSLNNINLLLTSDC